MSRNDFKNADDQSLTGRIAQTDIKTTIAWLELLAGMSLQNKIAGETGKNDTSECITLVVDSNKVDKDDFEAHLKRWAESNKLKPKSYVSSCPMGVHLRTPINGKPNLGYVQTDFWFTKKPEFVKFFLSEPDGSEYTGVERRILLTSIAKSLGYKINQNAGLIDPAKKKAYTNIDAIAKLLLGDAATEQDLNSVETILDAIKDDKKRDEKLKYAREKFASRGIPFMESESDTNFLARLRDRIVNQGMVPLVEASRIEHLEDLVFERGCRGILEALSIIAHSAENVADAVSLKWDGIALVWGRKPNGDFVLTDKSGFTAKSYDGLSSTPEQLAAIMSRRKGDRAELIDMYTQLFPVLKAATPDTFRGFVMGDLLFTQRPPESAGAFKFQPNFIEYNIPRDTLLGEKIGESNIGIAVHTRFDGVHSPEQPLKNMTFNPVNGLLLIDPSYNQVHTVTPCERIISQITHILDNHGRDIDQLFNPMELRSARITDFPKLCKRYINSRISSNYDDLLTGFAEWLRGNVSNGKFNNIVEYLQSPSSNLDGLSAAFTEFLLLHELKSDMLGQLNNQQPGQEGWVLATPSGRAKLVDRFNFSAGNRAMWDGKTPK